MMLFDDVEEKVPMKLSQKRSPDRTWEPGPSCQKQHKFCRGMAFGENEPCNWCGLYEDGAYDTRGCKTKEMFMSKTKHVCACGCGIELNINPDDWFFKTFDSDSGVMLFFHATECMDKYSTKHPDVAAQNLNSFTAGAH